MRRLFHLKANNKTRKYRSTAFSRTIVARSVVSSRAQEAMTDAVWRSCSSEEKHGFFLSVGYSDLFLQSISHRFHFLSLSLSVVERVFLNTSW